MQLTDLPSGWCGRVELDSDGTITALNLSDPSPQPQAEPVTLDHGDLAARVWAAIEQAHLPGADIHRRRHLVHQLLDLLNIRVDRGLGPLRVDAVIVAESTGHVVGYRLGNQRFLNDATPWAMVDFDAHSEHAVAS